MEATSAVLRPRAAPTVRAAYPTAGDPSPAPHRPLIDLSQPRRFPWRRNEPHEALPRLDGRTILVVDDDPDALELLHMVLESCGAKVLAASTAMHARGYLMNVTPDLIVCDLALPREDGPAFMRVVRASPNSRLARVPAVAVTAFYEDYPTTRAKEFAAYFQKPIDIDALTHTIVAILRPSGPPTDR